MARPDRVRSSSYRRPTRAQARPRVVRGAAGTRSWLLHGLGESLGVGGEAGEQSIKFFEVAGLP